LVKKFALALTSDPFDVSLSLLRGTNSDFLGEATPGSMDKNVKLAISSETTVQINTLKDYSSK
jgi:hypothetical protein